MKRFSILTLLFVMVISAMTIGCRDEKDPEYNIDLLYKRAWREEGMKNLRDLFSQRMNENNNDLESPAMKEFRDVVVPGLAKAYMKFTRDQANRIAILELLAQMNDDRAAEVFVEGLALEDTNSSKMFTVASSAAQRQKLEAALPALIKGYEACKNARASRPGAPFTVAENELVQAFISASSSILTKHPNSSHKKAVVKAFVEIVDTPDTLQELRLNMKAMKGLGRIGDSDAIPVLIRGIAQKGVNQPIPLGTIAFAALQQIHDRDAVVKAILDFAHGKDQAFNKKYEKELKNDPAMKNPLWFIEQTTRFLGDLNYASPAVLKFLKGEFNHNEADDKDKAVAELEGLPIKMDADGWAQVRRNWAAVSLANLNRVEIADDLVSRIKFSGSKLETPMEEAVGYFRAMGLLVVPDKFCPVMLKAVKSADDSLRDKLFYNASQMCSAKFLPAMDKAIKKINCDKIVKDRLGADPKKDEETQVRNECQVMIKRIEGYKDRIQFGKECGEKLDCYLKEIGNHTSKNMERAMLTAFRMARADKSKQQKVVDTLTDNLDNPSQAALKTSVRVLDHLTPKGGEKLEKKIVEIYANFARQSTKTGQARLLESFIGHVRNRARK